jgi:hypothetical protein
LPRNSASARSRWSVCAWTSPRCRLRAARAYRRVDVLERISLIPASAAHLAAWVLCHHPPAGAAVLTAVAQRRPHPWHRWIDRRNRGEFGANDVPEHLALPQSTSGHRVRRPDLHAAGARGSVTGATVSGTRIPSSPSTTTAFRRPLLNGYQTTNNAGLATFGDLSFDPGSTGGFRLVVGGGVVGRPAISVGQATSTKVNSKPAK